MHKYLPKFYHFIDNLNIENIERLNNKVALIYRNYEKKPNENEIIKFKKYCKKNNKKFLISNYYDLVKKYKLDGLYLPSFNKNTRYNCFKFKKNFDIIGSAHNVAELNTKIRQSVKSIFIAPVFKKKRFKLGIYGFLRLKNFTSKDLIVLGGVTEEKMNMTII